MSPTAQAGTYDYNWHWYDAAGRRVVSQRTLGSSWVPGGGAPSGSRTLYVYDGDDVALTVVKSGTCQSSLETPQELASEIPHLGWE